ncbi:hypothetical protein F4782DRAFT_523061 [Xylaria castorea]|nr:hypothetical protein F4782DRAFT_523061 [Xylaria castorea]
MSGDLNDTICLPMKLDAFVFNGPVCSGGAEADEARAKIAPITQPNYTMLRINDALIQSDILPHVDIHNTYKNEYNSRLTNLDTGTPYRHRQGVYLHWMLPRVYRSGVAATGEGDVDREGEGLPASEDSSAPQFRSIPSRWLVIRRLRESVPDYKTIGVHEYEAWVIESDKQRKLGDPTKPENLPKDIDVQVDVAPFISAPLNKEVNINEQAEVFIGSKTRMSRWTEMGDVRSPVTVLNGGNMLFPDYQYHNANVLSVLDNFEYGSGDNVKYMQSATADYYVIGWHTLADQDPFTITDRTTKRSQRLETFQMRFNEKSKDGASWSAPSKSGQTVCHGTMYKVEWDQEKRPQNIPADKLCEDLQKLSPISFGTTALDSLLAYVKAQQAHETDEALKNVMIAIVNIQKYLLVDEDTVDGHDRAEDLLYNTNFDNLSGGARYHIAGATNPTKPTEKPDQLIIDGLSSLNQEQRRLDALDRCEERIRWNIFSIWWGYVSRGTNPTETDQQDTKKLLAPLTALADELAAKRRESQKKKKDVLDKPQIKSLIEEKVISLTARSNFHTQQDPTLIVGNIQSAWPHDWLDQLIVRVNTDITTWGSQGKPDVGDDIDLRKLPSEIQDTVSALIKEFIELGKDNDGDSPLAPDAITPLYHDIEPGQITRRDDWGHTQPFFPLFLEWEAEYAHVDYAQWSLDSRVFSGQASEKVSFGMASQEPLYDKDEWNPEKTPKAKQNIRFLSGRVLILPQASFSLYAQIKQLIDQTPREELEEALGDMKPETLLADLSKLKFLSSPLSGLHENLLTVCQGTHIKPLVRYSGKKLQIIKDANDIKAGFEDNVVHYMGTETDLTPYAGLVSLSKETEDSPFKPATHGQFKLTKLNIVDKFGQVIHALDPRWDAQPQNIRPCISEFLAPQSLPDNVPNIVEKPKPGEKGSHYVQMPPHINQWATVNSEFMAMTEDGKWVPQNEWDKPIWGWVVYNYLDKAVQFFLEDGTFYQEVRMGENGAVKSEQWLPFKMTEKVEDKNHQLDRLIYHAATDDGYLESMLSMIAGAMESAAVAPDAYGQFLNSIIGRPLALINMGWSLELGTDENTNQSKVNEKPPLRHLLPSSASNTVADDKLYKFPLKMGDEHRAYDGLVGYFKTRDPKDQKPDDYLDLSTCYTYFGTKNKVPGSELDLVKIDNTNYPLLDPFYIDPITTDAAGMENKHNEMLSQRTFGAIVDPFRPVHGYTSILPTQPLKIPEWTWQDALVRMTAFFHFGPLNITKDVQEFDSDYLLTEKTDIKKDSSVIPNGIRLPQMGTADWVWLQPYSLLPQENPEEKEEKEETCFMPLGIAGAETVPKFEEGPYTSAEGYLLLRQPLVRAD